MIANIEIQDENTKFGTDWNRLTLNQCEGG